MVFNTSLKIILNKAKIFCETGSNGQVIFQGSAFIWRHHSFNGEKTVNAKKYLESEGREHLLFLLEFDYLSSVDNEHMYALHYLLMSKQMMFVHYKAIYSNIKSAILKVGPRNCKARTSHFLQKFDGLRCLINMQIANAY